jgi:hypothetical protein
MSMSCIEVDRCCVVVEATSDRDYDDTFLCIAAVSLIFSAALSCIIVSRTLCSISVEAASYFSWTSVILDLSSDWVLDTKAEREREGKRERGREVKP